MALGDDAHSLDAIEVQPIAIDSANERGSALFDALLRRTFAAVDDLEAGSAMGLDAAM